MYNLKILFKDFDDYVRLEGLVNFYFTRDDLFVVFQFKNVEDTRKLSLDTIVEVVDYTSDTIKLLYIQ